VYDELIHRRFAAVATACRDRVALRTADGTYTFGELDYRRRRVAALLPGTGRVAIVTRDHSWITPALLGALTAGWAFAVLEPGERTAAQIARLGCSRVLDDAALVRASRASDVDAGDGDAMGSIYFTSGSTGTPRAIAGRVRGIDHHIGWEIEFLGADATTRGAIIHAPTYDAYLPDVLVPMCAGGMVIVPPPGLVGEALRRWIVAEGITLLHCVPSVFRALLGGGLGEVKHVLLAGEVVRVSDVQAARAVTEARLINLYGPTEATFVKLHHEIGDEVGEVPIGKPMPGVTVELIDGQIAIRSPYGALGYLDETSDNFRPDGTYLTGDYGEYRHDGALLFRGRRDRQVKLLGARVDLDEVEAIVAGCEGVREAVIVADASSTILHGAVVLDAAASLAVVRAEVMRRLTPAMRLARLRQVDALPRLASGKLDRTRIAETLEAG
jgi:acyl-coenzyme A synthetase/AMP-(fatty) acid ligase